MKKLLVLSLLMVTFNINAFPDVFYLKYSDGSVSRTISYSQVIVKDRNGVIIFRGKTDKYGRVKVINTNGKAIEVKYNGNWYRSEQITIRNNDQRTTVVIKKRIN